MYILLSNFPQPCRIEDVTNFRSIDFHLSAVQVVKLGVGTPQVIMQHATTSVQFKSRKTKLHGLGAA